MPQHEKLNHNIPALWDADSKVLILGTMPSPKSREMGFFYGHPQNRFWRVLAAVLNTPVPDSIAEKRALLLKNHIAVTDVLSSCEIVGASDASIKNPVPMDVSKILSGADIRCIFTNGKKATELYKKLIYPIVERPSVYLPSTSPANCAVSFENLCKAYEAILPCINGDAK